MKELLHRILPPTKWLVPVIIAAGVFVGLGLFVIKIANLPSYLSDKPETCINCHIMVPQYESWAHSSHRERAHCNDCHVPQYNMLAKYYFKAKDGMRHSAMFTLRAEPQSIIIHEEGANEVQKNCVRCHENTITDTKLMLRTKIVDNDRRERKCWTCHRETPHGRVNSIGSVRISNAPTPKSLVPEWINEAIEEVEE